MNVRRAGTLLTSVVVLFALPSLAYILPGGSILRRMAETRNGLQLSSVKVEGSLTFKGPAVAEAASALALSPERPELAMDGTVSLKLPGRCRIDVTTPQGGKVAAAQSAGKSRWEGTEIPSLRVALDAICNILAVRSSSDTESRAVVERYLRAQGVEVQRTSLARFGGTVAYVLGEVTAGKPQFSVYKDSFLPARLRYTDAQGVAWDIRFLDYASAATGEWFPRQVEVYRGPELVLRFVGLSASRGALSDKLF